MIDGDNPNSFAGIAEASGHAGYLWDVEADHITWHGAWRDVFGAECAAPPVNSRDLSMWVLADDRAMLIQDHSDRTDRVWRLQRPNGSIVWIHEHAVVERKDERALRQRGLLSRVDAPARSQPAQVMHHRRDHLTGRPDRLGMLERMGSVLDGPRDIRPISGYLVVSVDKMAFVNEAVGMKSADALLCGVADRLASLIPPQGLLARVGGDMFGVLLPGAGSDMAALAERIVASFRDRPVAALVAPIHVTVSVGGVAFDGLPLSAAEFMIRAEQALHMAQLRGRNQYVEYEESASRAQENRAMLEMGERVKRALKTRDMKLAYQPVIDSATGEIVFYEALARLFDEQARLIPAYQFIPIVEQLGLSSEFDRAILDIALKEMDQFPDLTLAVNISGLTAAEADWPGHIRNVLTGREDLARRLIIEITETAAIVDITETMRFIEALTGLGGRVSLDDFGAGFTSIRYLRTLDLAIMKLDRELLINMIGNPDQEQMVRMLVGIARGFGIRVVAEGIEAEDVANWMRHERVEMMQGYFFGRPSLARPWRGETEQAVSQTA